jgi:hypothetical protein
MEHILIIFFTGPLLVHSLEEQDLEALGHRDQNLALVHVEPNSLRNTPCIVRALSPLVYDLSNRA